MEGETIRDAVLSASGQLSVRRGGPGVRAPLPLEVTATLLKDQWLVTGDDDDHRRRSIDLFVLHNLRYPMFDVFDRPDTNASCALRHESTTVTQSLVLLNSEFSLHCARWLAGALIRSEPASGGRQIEAAYLRQMHSGTLDGAIFLSRLQLESPLEWPEPAISDVIRELSIFAPPRNRMDQTVQPLQFDELEVERSRPGAH